FPTGLKWELCRNAKGKEKYIVCNADEGDPGAFMDRSVLEADPHSVLEGMIIGAYAIGASEGCIYVRHEYPLALERINKAIEQANAYGLLGEKIFDTSFHFKVHVIQGGGAFVCGEESALLNSIMGRRPEPIQRPPFPVQKGLWGKPTNINNVETWANISPIINNDGEWYANIGTETSKGTKIFSLVGKIKNTGLVEVPMGITIKKIIYDIGGGSASKSTIKAVQTGGPSGGCIPSQQFDIAIDYESLKAAGSIMGSGGMIVMDQNTCMVDIAKYFMNFLKDESCGKCFTCREGTQRMYEILDDISRGEGTLEKLQLLEELAEVVQDSTMCGLGQTASNPVLSTLKYFREEYIEHIVHKRCSAGICTELVGAPCQSNCPLGTEAWRYVAHIARGEYEEAYQAIREANPFPSVCARVCNHPCEEKCKAGVIEGEPIAIRALKRFVCDQTDPSIFKPKRMAIADENSPKVAVVGSGPAGLSAAHYLSLRGYKVTVFESDDRPGGMMLSAIPSYRLPREAMQKEIASLLDENITVRCETTLGQDFTIESLFKDGYGAVFLALGAHKSRKLDIPKEDIEGVFPSIQFLKSFNLDGQQSARGHVGVIGGGNSAVDAARVALRQRGVESVTIFYRRTREEMPAFEEEIEAAIQEGVKLETLVTPIEILTHNGRCSGVKFLRNELGDVDSSGRRRPIPMEGTEFTTSLDTLVVAISEGSDIDCVAVASSMRIETTKWDTIQIDFETLCTNQPGVFAGGDVIRGPNTVVEAIADGKKAAIMIDRYLRKEDLKQPAEVRLPEIYIEPLIRDEEEISPAKRIELPRASVEWRRRGFAEVEMSLTAEEAKCEANRCYRCDLEFTRRKLEEKEVIENEVLEVEVKS
ncbi:MAG: FAD-dependent oxidoreductase, partial [Deltaproteobacteria bacterium]|nr:FAD-dependent oxidoreductase [Deltaproteobacteria bacterium]